MIKFKTGARTQSFCVLGSHADSSSSWAVQLALGVAGGEGSTELQPCSSYMRPLGDGS